VKEPDYNAMKEPALSLLALSKPYLISIVK